MIEIIETFVLWVWANKEWLFGGIGIAAFLWILDFFTGMIRWLFRLVFRIILRDIKKTDTEKAQDTEKTCKHTSEERKRLTKILFIDDNTDFKVVDILKRAGWKNTRIIKKVSGPDDANIHNADICFVDINGVAVDLFPKDQGLGLVAAIKKRHSSKKVVVYSSQRRRDVFDDLWEAADDKLPKNADPYQFENLVELYSEQIYC